MNTSNWRKNRADLKGSSFFPSFTLKTEISANTFDLQPAFALPQILENSTTNADFQGPTIFPVKPGVQFLTRLHGHE